MRRAIHGLVYLGFTTLCACAQSEGAGDGGGTYTNVGGQGNAGGLGGGFSGAGGSAAGGSGAGGGGSAAGAAGAAGVAGASSGGGAQNSGGAQNAGGSGASAGAGGSGATGGSTTGGGGSSSGGTTSGGGGAATGGTSGTGGVPPKSDCCSGTPFVPGCTTPSVSACVCAKDPYCCKVEWDDACAGETLLYKCGTCPTPADCCSASKCSSDAVTECVGKSDAACLTTWSATCASKVTSLGCGSCGTTPPPTATVWINELHYDNASTDAGEGVEVAGTAGADLTGWSLVFYNGAPGQLKQYMSKTLTGVIPNQKNGFGTLWTAAANMQNGGADGAPEPDGVALVDKAGKVVQFLSYEGKFTPTDGPASGLASVDIGKSELSTTPIGQSLQLTGTGKKYADFTWSGPVAATPGQPNAGQSF